MKLIFNDATEIMVQQVEPRGDYLRILVVGTTPEQLKVLFTDSRRTARMIAQERGQTIATYEGYTAFYRTEIYTGKIYGVVMYKAEKTPEAQSSMVQAAVLVAQIQAQSLTDEQAVTVKDIYPVWDGNGVSYPEGYYLTYSGTLYKVLQAHTSQADWSPDVPFRGGAPGAGRYRDRGVGTAGIYKPVYDWKPGDAQRQDLGVIN